MKQVIISLIGAMLLGSCATRQDDHDRILALSWKQFDETPGSGWHSYALRRDYREAAKLIGDYIDRHPELTDSQKAIAHFHAGVVFALDGKTSAALVHLDQAMIHDTSVGLPEDWNDMLVAQKSFLHHDRTQLIATRERIAGWLQSRVRLPVAVAELWR
jgi:hypothetical protein